MENHTHHFVKKEGICVKKRCILLIVAALLCSFPCLGLEDADAPITRGEAAAWFVEHLGIESPGDLSAYFDVPEDAWYFDALSHAVGAGLFQGYQGSLRPDAPLEQRELDLVFSRLSHAPVSSYGTQLVSHQSFEQQVSDRFGSSVASGQTGVVQGSATICSPMSLDGLFVKGDLWIGDSAGDVQLNDVQVGGRLILRGSGAVELSGLTGANSVTVLGPATLVSHTAARPSCLFDTPHATVQGSFLSILVESSGTLSLESADVDSIFVSADHEVLLLDERSKVGQITLQGDHGVLAGSGWVDQVIAGGQNIHIEADGGTVFALEGSGGVRAQGTLIPAGTYAVGDAKPDTPVTTAPKPSWSGGSSGSSGGSSKPPQPDDTDPDPIPDPDPEPDTPQPPAADSVALWSAGGAAQLTTQAQDDVLSIQASATLEPGYPSPDIAALYQNRQTDVPFATVGLSFALPQLPSDGQTILRLESQALAALGYTSEDNTAQCQYTAKGDQVEAVVTLANQDLLERGALELPLLFLQGEEPVSLSIDWGQGPQRYAVDVSGVSFVISQLGEPVITLPSQQEETENQGLLTVDWEGAATLSLYDGQDQLLWDQQGPALQWNLLDAQGAYPQPGTEISIQAVDSGGHQDSRQITLTSADLLAAIPQQDGFFVNAPYPDWLGEEGEEIYTVLNGLFEDETLTCDANILRVDAGGFSPELAQWCQQAFGRPCVPVQVMSSLASSEEIPIDPDWNVPLIWLPLDGSGPALQAYRFTDGSDVFSFYVLFES